MTAFDQATPGTWAGGDASASGCAASGRRTLPMCSASPFYISERESGTARAPVDGDVVGSFADAAPPIRARSRATGPSCSLRPTRGPRSRPQGRRAGPDAPDRTRGILDAARRLSSRSRRSCGSARHPRCEVTLPHGGGVVDPTDPEVVRTAAHRRCEIVDAGPGWIVTVNERDAEATRRPWRSVSPAVRRHHGVCRRSCAWPTDSERSEVRPAAVSAGSCSSPCRARARRRAGRDSGSSA